jgi:hypothetical protein
LAASAATEDDQAVETRLREAALFLASDQLEGRGVGGAGLNTAADYLAGAFEQLGLKVDSYGGTPFQKFQMTTGARLGPANTLVLLGPPEASGQAPRRVELKLGRDFNPLTLGGSAAFQLPLVFAGYGITAPDEKYDDYAGLDVQGKAVVILRHEPQQANPHSPFNGTRHSSHAPFVRKVANAYEHGAAAVILCTDQFDIEKTLADWERRWLAALDELAAEQTKFKALAAPSTEERQAHRAKVNELLKTVEQCQQRLEEARDPLLPFDGAGGSGESRRLPVLYCRRSVVDEVVRAATGESLAQIEQAIDQGPAPRSRLLQGWSAQGQTDLILEQAEVKNVVAVLEGAGPLAEETIVIGAHYDHLGWGGTNSAAPGVREVHNGADDNASGVAVLVEVARQLAHRPARLPRRVVLAAFTGEELGLIGSARYVREPLVPIEQTIAMLNMDMVGRLDQEKLIVHGTGTAELLDTLVDRYGREQGLQIVKKPEGFGPSDHSSFYAKRVPVLHFFTGNHADYHRPSDDVEKLNLAGMRRVARLVTDLTVALAEAPQRPAYLETKGSPLAGGGGDRPYFGSIPDFSQDQPGYALMGVTKGGPAERAGLKAGDIIVRLGASQIGNLEGFDSALRKHKAGERVGVVVRRGGEEIPFQVTLDPPR